ncbi:MAG: nuclear transport factor 2 family protein [Gemmatimonadales bacterium]
MTTRLTDEFMGAQQRFEATAELGPLLALFHDDGEALNLGRAEPARGHDELEIYWREYRAMFRGIFTEFTHVIEGDAGAVLEWVSRGALANGESVEYKGVTVLETNAGRIHRCRKYYDSAVFMSGGRGDRAVSGER